MEKIITRDGTESGWEHLEGYKYRATGVTVEGKRFSITSSQWYFISSLNLWRGSKWLIDFEGKKYLIQRVYN